MFHCKLGSVTTSRIYDNFLRSHPHSFGMSLSKFFAKDSKKRKLDKSTPCEEPSVIGNLIEGLGEDDATVELNAKGSCKRCGKHSDKGTWQGKARNQFVCSDCNCYALKQNRAFKSGQVDVAEWARLSEKERKQFEDEYSKLSQSELTEKNGADNITTQEPFARSEVWRASSWPALVLVSRPLQIL